MPRGGSIFKHFSRSREVDADLPEANMTPRRRHSKGSPSALSLGTLFRRRPSTGNADVRKTNGASSTSRASFTSKSSGPGKRFSNVFGKSAFSAIISASPMGCRSPKSVMFSHSPRSLPGWLTPSKSPKFMVKSPTKYRKKKSSEDIDRELQAVIDQEILDMGGDIDDIPGCLSQSLDTCAESSFLDRAESSFLDLRTIPLGTSLASRRRNFFMTDASVVDKENYRQSAADTAEARFLEEEDSERLRRKTVQAMTQIQAFNSISDPAAFNRNATRIREKMKKLEVLQNQLVVPENGDHGNGHILSQLVDNQLSRDEGLLIARGDTTGVQKGAQEPPRISFRDFGALRTM